MTDPATLARSVLDASRYMTLGTADEAGAPWAAPVYFAIEAYTELFWVSSPDTRHSCNIAVQPQVAIVVFDSGVAIGEARAVYLAAVAEELADAELERGIDVFSRRSVAHGAGPWSAADVRGAARLRLYRATVSDASFLDAAAGGGDRRVAVTLAAD